MNIKSLYNYFLKSPESQWVMQYDNALNLYNWIKENPVKNVLSLGTGIGLSDAVIALAFRDKNDETAHIDSIEQYDKCIKLANQLIPEELKKYITIHKSDPTVWNTEKIPYQYFSIYKELLEKDYDLIINDGPSPFMDKENYIDLPNGTIHKFLLEDKIKPGTTIIYDGRIQSLKILERYFSENFYIKFLPEKNGDFNVLEKKDTPVLFKDEMLLAMQQQTSYFKNHESPIPNNEQGSPSKTEITN